MKKRNNAFARLVGLLLVSATVLTLTVAATGGAGTSSDPLVTLSYLNEKFLPQILSEVDKKTASREQTLSSKLTEQVKSETQGLLESVCSREAVFLSTPERICGRNFSFK